MAGDIGDLEGEDIRKQVDRLLRDLGNPEPPISLDAVRTQLNLDRRYYSTADPGILDEVTHRVRIGGRQLLRKAASLFDIAKKAGLCAFWVPQSRRILIDEDVPKKKHRWVEAHEVGHSIIPWHETYLFGDTEQTLDPACHAAVEAEANYAAGQILFLGERFGGEARDLEVTFKSVQSLSKRYGNSLTSTLWRIVEERDPQRPVFGMVSAHPRFPAIGAADNGEPMRHFIRSAGFRTRFSGVTPEDAYTVLRLHSSWSRRGIICDVDHPMADDNGQVCEFRVSSLATPYYVLTYGMFQRALPPLVSVVGRPRRTS